MASAAIQPKTSMVATAAQTRHGSRQAVLPTCALRAGPRSEERVSHNAAITRTNGAVTRTTSTSIVARNHPARDHSLDFKTASRMPQLARIRHRASQHSRPSRCWRQVQIQEVAIRLLALLLLHRKLIPSPTLRVMLRVQHRHRHKSLPLGSQVFPRGLVAYRPSCRHN